MNTERDMVEALLELSRMRGASRKELADFTLEVCVRLTESKVGYLHFINPDEKSIYLYTWSEDVLKNCTAEKVEHYPIEDAGVWADCVRIREPVIHNDYQNLPEKKGYPDGHFPLLRHASVPIFDQEKIVSAIGVGNKEEPYEHDDIDKVSLFMNAMWEMIKRQEAESSLTELNLNLERMVEERTSELKEVNKKYEKEISEREKIEESLREREKSLEGAQKIAHMGSWDLDLVENKLTWSDEIYRIFGLQPQEFGATFEAFLESVHPEDRDFVNSSYTNAVQYKTPYNIVHRILKPDDEIRFVHEMAADIHDENGKAIRSIGTVQDITERILAEKEKEKLIETLEEMNKELVRANRLKDEILANTSHELRTPLNSILGLLKLIIDGLYKDKKEMKGFIDQAYNSSQHLLLIVNDLIDLARIESGKLVLKYDHEDVRTLVKTVESILKNELTEEGLGFKAHFPEENECKIFTDGERLKHVLHNIIGNSIKFTPEGTVTLNVSKSGDEMLFEIIDTGIGVEEEDMEYLFKPFVQLDGSSSRKYGGTGCGLAISKKLVDKMGGKIWMESDGKGRGTKVSFTIPLMPPEEKNE